MTHLKTYATPTEKREKKVTYRVVCLDWADVQAATQLERTIQVEFLGGKNRNIAFSSLDRTEAEQWQEKLNNLANSLRMPKGSSPVEVGQKIKQEVAARHGQHQSERAVLVKRKSDQYKQKKQRRY